VAWVRSEVKPYVSSKYFGFPCQFSFHQLLHIHHSILAASLNNESEKKYKLKMRMFIVASLNPSSQMQG
jgi:hypothetical protein